MRQILNRFSQKFKALSKPTLLMGVLAFTQIKFQSVILENGNGKKYSDSLHDSFNRSLNDEFYKNAIILSGNANQELAQEITDYLQTHLGKVKIDRFQDGECNIQIIDNIRGKDIFIIQPTCPPVNENLMELLLLVTTLRRASARKINVVVPYYGYSRQVIITKISQKNRINSPTSLKITVLAADVARLLESVGVDRVISVDLHCDQIQGYFGPKVPVDNLEANIVAINYLNTQDQYSFKEVVVVSPDAGGVARAKKFQEQLQAARPDIKTNFAIIIKQREETGQISQVNLVGQVKDKDVIIVDDMIDRAVTTCEAAKVLKEMGANRVLAFATHGLFSGNAIQNIKDSSIDQIIVTNTIPPNTCEAELGNKILRLSVAPLLAEAIYRIQIRDSVSGLAAKNLIIKKAST